MVFPRPLLERTAQESALTLIHQNDPRGLDLALKGLAEAADRLRHVYALCNEALGDLGAAHANSVPAEAPATARPGKRRGTKKPAEAQDSGSPTAKTHDRARQHREYLASGYLILVKDTQTENDRVREWRELLSTGLAMLASRLDQQVDPTGKRPSRTAACAALLRVQPLSPEWPKALALAAAEVKALIPQEEATCDWKSLSRGQGDYMKAIVKHFQPGERFGFKEAARRIKGKSPRAARAMLDALYERGAIKKLVDARNPYYWEDKPRDMPE